MRIARTQLREFILVATGAALALLGVESPAVAQRLLGIDISAHQGNIFQNATGNPSDSNWATLHGANNRDFAFIRSSRGGTTGYDHRQGGYPDGLPAGSGEPDNNDAFNLSQRYDDPYFVQNINRATTQGLYAGPYHRSRADVVASTPNSGGIANTGTDDSTHFIQMAGAWMRPGYLVPVLDFEDGETQHTDQEMAQFALDFSNRIYQVMQIRPAIYINGNYAHFVVGGGTSAQRAELAQQSSNAPSVVSPAFPTLWTARWPNQANPNSIDIQNSNPKDHIDVITGNPTPTVYGPWDDFGVAQPWAFWQYASTAKLSGYKNGTTNIDVDVSHGDLEYLKDSLVPAIWWHDTSGNWSTLTNWNSGQPVVAPLGPPTVPSCGTCMSGTGQLAPIGTQTLPTPRLPGAPGTGPAVTSGVNDTVILERPNANITVTLSSGTYNIRKLYVRETLNISGGSLTVNYNPNYTVPLDGGGNPLYPNALRSGPISAQFSGPVALSGSGALNVHTLQVDATQTFTLGGGTLTFNTINLMPHSTTPAKIAMNGTVNFVPLSNATATIGSGSGSGSSGLIDLVGGTRNFNVSNGSAAVDLSVNVPITNGGLTKSGAGTMQLGAANTFTGPVTIAGGVLRSGNAAGLSSSSVVTVNNSGTWDMNGISDTVAGLASTPGENTGTILQGAANLTVDAAGGITTFGGSITGTGTFTKNGASSQYLTGTNTLGAVNVNAGSLILNATNTTGAVTVNGGTLGGTGSVSGAVTVNSGGHVSPGASIESLGVGAMTLNAGSVLDFEVGGIAGLTDRINVTGLLTLTGGSVNIMDAGFMDYGDYTLIDYGTLSGSVTNLGTPTGPAGFAYSLIDTGSVIKLSVSPVGVPGDYNNDGSVDAGDYIVWAKNKNTSNPLPNDNGLGGMIGSAHYDLWHTNFGNTVQGAGSGEGGAVPEPATGGLLVLGMIGVLARRPARKRDL